MNETHLHDRELIRAGEESDSDLAKELARRLEEAIRDRDWHKARNRETQTIPFH